MLKPVVFWGATGQAKVLREFIGPLGYQLVALFDNDLTVGAPFDDVPLYYGVEGFHRWRDQQPKIPASCLVAIGGARGRARVEVQQFLTRHDLAPLTAVHPTAFVARSAIIGPGSQILAKAAVCAEVRMGDACIVNTASSVDHECVLGCGVHVAPGAVLAGAVTVGDFSLIGPGAVVLPRIRIGRNAIVGAGAVVTSDVPDGKVAFGNPARIRRDNVDAQEGCLTCLTI